MKHSVPEELTAAHAELQAAKKDLETTTDKLRAQQHAAAEIRQGIAAADRLAATATDCAARELAGMASAEEVEAAKLAAASAASEASVARQRLATLDRAVELLGEVQRQKSAAVTQASDSFDQQIASWLKTRSQAAFDAYDKALQDMAGSIASWHAHSELTHVAVKNPNAPFPVALAGEIFIADLQRGPDQGPWKRSDLGHFKLTVTGPQVESFKAEIRAELAQAGVTI